MRALLNRNSQNTVIANSRNEKWLIAATLILLAGGFLGTIYWLRSANIYYAHFFDHGTNILTYNIFRIIFAAFLIWIIYAVGYAALYLAISPFSKPNFSLSERLILGFGIGLGVWHILLFALGLVNLYYFNLMLALCLAVLLFSAKHFKHTIDDFEQLVRKSNLLSRLTMLLIGIALFWLMLVRGIYPGGGGDYYTHYFYYYIDVIRNHGLIPNDVWYHYYYSKGAGLQFLGMILTDPEAPEIATFCCVSIAALALASLTKKMIADSLWPAFAALLYIIYNLVSLSGVGGEFQKTHEETTALVIMVTWAMCFYTFKPSSWIKPLFLMIASITIAAAIVTQAIAMLFGLLFGVFALIELLKRKWQQFGFYTLLGLIAATAVISVFFINYMITGLATDQAINLTWRFANLERLNQWGVIPNVMMVMWIRDNYVAIIVPWGLGTIKQLATFMRLNELWLIFFSASVALICYKLISKSKSISNDQKKNPILLNICFNISVVIITFAILSAVEGRPQPVSFFRFSSFFVPLIILFTAMCFSLLVDKLISIREPFLYVLRIELPVVLLFLTLFSWKGWMHDVNYITTAALRFAKGEYSLSDAYSKQSRGLPFGGINPGAYAAVQHVPSGSRVWSTNVDSYCMVPNCKIESIISFKLSSQLNEILNSPAEEAKKILQQEKLNYFIYSTESTLLDLLPYSHLFNPDNISKYFTIKWTDGKTYLLTWREQHSAPLTMTFLKNYRQHFNLPENSWFLFKEAVPNMDKTMKLITQSPHPWKSIEMPWKEARLHKVKNGINVIEATYGENCQAFKTSYPLANSVHKGNATSFVQSACNDKTVCEYTVTDKQLKDPANGCAKNFTVSYQCPWRKDEINVSLPGEALWKKINLDCRKPNGIEVVNATYGTHCKIKHTRWYSFKERKPANVTAQVRTACYGKKECSIIATNKWLQTDMQKCEKGFKATYYCPGKKDALFVSFEEDNTKTQLNFGC